MRVGFIGLGNMGKPMAENLLKAGRALTVFDVFEAPVSSLVEQGAKAAKTPSEVASECDVVITMLPSSPHVKEVYQGTDGILSSVREGALLMDCSTIDAAATREVACAASGMGARLVDAPVSGGTPAATAGTLTFMVGGESDALEDAKPFLFDMGTNVVHCGGAGIHIFSLPTYSSTFFQPIT